MKVQGHTAEVLRMFRPKAGQVQNYGVARLGACQRVAGAVPWKGRGTEGAWAMLVTFRGAARAVTR